MGILYALSRNPAYSNRPGVFLDLTMSQLKGLARVDLQFCERFGRKPILLGVVLVFILDFSKGEIGLPVFPLRLSKL